MRKRYVIEEQAADHLGSASVFEQLQSQAPSIGEEYELELSQAQEKAMIAAGWISEPVEPKSKKKEG